MELGLLPRDMPLLGGRLFSVKFCREPTEKVIDLLKQNTGVNQLVTLISELGINYWRSLSDICRKKGIGWMRYPIDNDETPDILRFSCLVKSVFSHIARGEIVMIHVPGDIKGIAGVLTACVIRHIGIHDFSQFIISLNTWMSSAQQFEFVMNYNPNAIEILDTDNTVFFFSGDKKEQNSWLSNFSSYPVVYKKKKYPTAEHLYQALKFEGVDDDYSESIRKSKSALYALHMGKSKKMRKDWDLVKYQKMLQVIRLKVQQNPDIKEKLLSTEDKRIVQFSSSYWGMGGDGVGGNHLGKIWMTVRLECAR